MLYRQDLWADKATKFNDGASILKVDLAKDVKPEFYSPFTNKVNGIPQWKLPSTGDNYDTSLIKDVTK